ncbi:hypothetical protein J19TS2_21610 [Cohnella xylanilytica]|uniref:cache domain-containing sensor histidine kinase n=1 Tax=Cohnella xylanilytica TaxID=557555 RepID=UPI001B00D877|nr:histidine kinase [Cohnella xylanilytica]GIO12606.1 hypothetical protein J19TS2_21610 [Cohnella xylanilytica]
MSGKPFNLSWNSVRLKLTVGLLLITLPTFAFLIYNNSYAIRVVHNQVAESNRSLVSMYMAQIDNSLNDVDVYLTNMIVNDKDLQELEFRTSEKERVLAKVRLDNKLRVDMATFPAVDSIFVYSVPGDDYFDSFRDTGEVMEREEVRSYIKRMIADMERTGQIKSAKWNIVRIGERHYLFRVLQTSDAYAGAWVNIENLSLPLNLMKLGDKGFSLFADDQGMPLTQAQAVREKAIDLSKDLGDYYLSGVDDEYLVVGEPSTKGNFSLIALMPDEQILENLPYLQRIASFTPIAAVILVPACLLLLRNLLLRPLNRISTAMKRIGEGHWNHRIEPYPTSDEFQLVNETFNRMIKQVQDLRISVYEEQLNKQKAELQHLQLQINPHFFMNSLNIIYNLALVKNFDLIQEMALSLVQYFRYMFRSNLTFVPLKDELQHVRNYIRIQQLRFPGKLDFDLSAPDYVANVRIPPLVIQSFIENSVKHGVSVPSSIHVSVKIDLVESDSEPKLSVEIKDTGKGFPSPILDDIRLGKRIEDEQGEHIGIWNVRQRLRLLYGENAGLTVDNAIPSGAIVKLLLPLQPPS